MKRIFTQLGSLTLHHSKEFVVNLQIPPKRSASRSHRAVYVLAMDVSSLLSFWKRTLLFLAVICFLCTSPMYAQWTQVWGGDFTGTANTTYNHANWWNNVEATAVWGDGTIQNTSDSLQNAYLDGNGDLVIAMTYSPNNAVPYTSARLTSTYAAGPYGRMDARIQNPGALGMGAAFWALGANAYPAATAPGTANPSTNGGVPWPWCGELDMMEIQAATNQHQGATVHGGETDSQTYYEYTGLSSTVNLTGGATFDNGFHVFSTEWGPYEMVYLLDGVQYGAINLAYLGATDQWEMNQPINFILSSGIGGNGGTPNGTGFPSNMVINYVNYSQWSAGAPAPVTGLTATATNSNAVTISWTASTTSGATYDIYATTTPGTAPTQADLIAQQVTGTSYVNTGLQPNTTYYYTVAAANFGGESSAANATVTTQAPGNSIGIQLSAGGYSVGTYMNSNPPGPAGAGAAGPAPFVLGGNTNYHFNIGPPAALSAVNNAQVTNPAPLAVYNVERWGPAEWTITGLNPLAGYNVRLHFVEWAHTAAGQRNFSVSINSDQVLTNFDIFADAGAAATAIAEEFYTTADENGIIEIQTLLGTTTVADLNPTINAIEIIPATGSNPVGAAPGTTTDLAINSGGPAVGNFVADEDFNGGDTATSTAAVTLNSNSAPANVYLSERYVPFTYTLTGLIADAPYALKLHFAETYWTGDGERIFSVSMNGKYVLNDLDVFKTAGGENIAYDPQFAANADEYGQIIVQFVYGGADQPFIDGIEAVQSGNPACTTIPSDPTGLTATASSSSVIRLSWNADTPPAHCSISSYSVYGSKTSGFTPSAGNLIASGVTGTSYSNTGLAASTIYYYVVEAVDADGTSGPSGQATATTQSGGGSCSAVPSAPTGLAATASSSSTIGLNWNAVTPPANCTISSYSIYGSTTSGFTPGSGNLIASGLTSPSYSDTGLSASTAYYFVVEAVDSFGPSAASAQQSATTQPAASGSEIVAIAAGGPAESNASGGDYSFVADEDFSGGGDNSPVTATINLTQPGANAAPMGVYQHGRAGAFTYTIPGLTAGSQYSVLLHFAETYFTVAGGREFNVAINGTTVLTNLDIYDTVGKNAALLETFTTAANSSGQIVIAFTLGAANQPLVMGIEIRSSSGGSCSAVPSAPTGLTATTSSSSAIGLSWSAVTPPANCTISSYSVYGSTTSGFIPSSSNLIASTTGTTYSNTGLAASTTHYYKVEAVDAAGSSAASTQASAETSAASCSAVPSAPTGLAATASSSSAIGLSWTAVTPPANCTISSYSLYGSKTSGFIPSSSNLIVSTTGTTYSNTGLAASTTYYYVIEAVDADGSSAASAQQFATTQAASGSTEVVAIAAGAPAEGNSGGGDYSFVADEDFSGGGDNSPVTATINLAQPGANAAPMAVYQYGRAGIFTYTIPGLTAGSKYTVLLHFAETYFTAAGDREFNVAINGTTVLTNLDVYGTVGKDAALLETFNTTANGSGQIVIAFTAGVANQPMVMGIEVRTN
jgi:fibronectin type 3 domain-containing protein